MQNIYAALLLHKAGKEVNEDNLKKVVVAAGVDADESQLKSLVASLKGVDIEKRIRKCELGFCCSSCKCTCGSKKKKQKPKEEKKEAAAEGLSALFG